MLSNLDRNDYEKMACMYNNFMHNALTKMFLYIMVLNQI